MSAANIFITIHNYCVRHIIARILRCIRNANRTIAVVVVAAAFEFVAVVVAAVDVAVDDSVVDFCIESI